MRPIRVLTFFFALVFTAGGLPCVAATVAGGGSPKTDCLLTLQIDGANKPAPPKVPKALDCVDGDLACDSDGLRNGECVFPLQVCANSTALSKCTSNGVNAVVIDHAVDNGSDRRFDTDFQALQSRVTGLGLPSAAPDRCTLSSSITVKLIGPDAANVMDRNRKILRVTTMGAAAAGAARDVDKVTFTCRPGGDGVYLPTNLYQGTFDRIRKQVFSQSCALSGCHDSQGNTGNLILLPGAAYGNLVNVTPHNSGAATAMLFRITPGNPASSYLYRKITNDLPFDWGDPMPKDNPPLDPALVELIRLWIVGDAALGPAPETGWVTGTDQ